MNWIQHSCPTDRYEQVYKMWKNFILLWFPQPQQLSLHILVSRLVLFLYDVIAYGRESVHVWIQPMSCAFISLEDDAVQRWNKQKIPVAFICLQRFPARYLFHWKQYMRTAFEKIVSMQNENRYIITTSASDGDHAICIVFFVVLLFSSMKKSVHHINIPVESESA